MADALREVLDVEGAVIGVLDRRTGDLDSACLELAAYLRQHHDIDEPERALRGVDVVYVRHFPWCHCGDGHRWHWDIADGPGPGAMLALVVDLY